MSSSADPAHGLSFIGFPLLTSVPAKKRQRRTPSPVAPEVRQTSASADAPPDNRFHYERFGDGSERPVRNVRRKTREREQALSDLFGVGSVLSPRANIRTMDSILAEIAGQLNVVEADVAPELLADAWQKAVGSFLSTQSELVSLARGTATIRTAHPAVRYELQRLKPQIVREINNVLGDGSVRSVRILHG